ncbi:phenylacetic acid degradation operon negative regulatory protein PaaX [Marinobacter sp. X15-166B]|uniref:phenylacetic acid degradation operon negative regulatory protein PaaX n=1 Tax=Marinobacter sp. X15-166B TaxID=1897620 RepID=UPI00085BD98A|nr:phenylacetic acid degradation operon negative regulatory protein PaaX [Marinobacter sp. X15-166B]OEY66347.1 phenylacetic acid degradation operon negative regulatory protein PaaX [Marinobacter sp. X15-166B]
MSAKHQLSNLINDFQERRPLRAGSLIITAYGDIIHPRGGSVWLGSLMKLLAPMGVSERLVRTSAYRLVQDGWLQTRKVGRCSYYSVTGAGLRRFQQAFEHVYSLGNEDWDGSWCLVFLNQLDPEVRAKVREELRWLSFGSMAPGVMEHPRFSRQELIPLLQEWGALDDTIVMKTQPMEQRSPRALRRQVKDSWNLDELGLRYKRFLEKFRPLWRELDNNDNLSPADCAIARLLLVHEYRKILLRDPLLPDELLPGDWEGRSAKHLCRNLYRAIYSRADDYLASILEGSSGPLPGPTTGFYRRFGGLRDDSGVAGVPTVAETSA